MKFVSNAKFGIPVEDGTIFRAKSGSTEISIHRIANCDGWFLNCKALGYWDKELESDSLMAAIKESKGIIEKRMESIQKRIKEIYETPIEIARY